MFAPAFPLAPVVGFLANLLSIKGRATAWCTAVQRPLPTVVPNIGPWLPIMELMSIVAVAVNLALIYKVNESAAWLPSSSFGSVSACSRHVRRARAAHARARPGMLRHMSTSTNSFHRGNIRLEVQKVY